MAAKAPAFQFYIKDWLSDPQLKMASFCVKGMWVDMLCYMWCAPEPGKLVGSEREIAKCMGATEAEIKTFITEAQRLNFCDVRFCDGNVQIINRRMHREWKDKEAARLRMQRLRSKDGMFGDCSRNVTPYSSSSSSTSIKKLYLECVRLTDAEMEKLVGKYGQKITDRAITILNNYIMSKGKDPYKSHYHTLIGWPTERAQEDLHGKIGKGNANDGPRVQPAEYIPERPPEVSAEARERVRSLTAGLAAKWKTPDSPTE
jgi:hypothetical protein